MNATSAKSKRSESVSSSRSGPTSKGLSPSASATTKWPLTARTTAGGSELLSSLTGLKPCTTIILARSARDITVPCARKLQTLQSNVLFAQAKQRRFVAAKDGVAKSTNKKRAQRTRSWRPRPCSNRSGSRKSRRRKLPGDSLGRGLPRPRRLRKPKRRPRHPRSRASALPVELRSVPSSWPRRRRARPWKRQLVTRRGRLKRRRRRPGPLEGSNGATWKLPAALHVLPERRLPQPDPSPATPPPVPGVRPVPHAVLLAANYAAAFAVSKSAPRP
mmetsp:Transcript_27693/g.63781  ORF Transcript_27693/g.63781 Transcript_27693/m.63781 type:complete len:275 (-) Transcript_27693:296-1120(-)